MIHIDRIPTPPDILLTKAQGAFDKAYDFYTNTPMEKRIQRKWEFDQVFWKERSVTAPLLDIFHRKCAFCEIQLSDRLNFEHFRPKGGAIGQDGSHDPDHYWWLAYQWENLYLICDRCNWNKANKFPVAGKRPKITSINFKLYKQQLSRDEYYKELAGEKALLLDPCLDFPEQELLFTDDGTVVGIDEQGRGRATIDVFGLNRDELVKDRAKAIVYMRKALEKISSSLSETSYSTKQVKDPQGYSDYSYDLQALSADAPYLGAKRQFIARWLQEHPEMATDPRLEPLLSPFYDQVKEKHPVITLEQSAVKSQYLEQKLKAETEKEHITIGKARYIKRIEIRNFRRLNSLELNFPEPCTDYIPWIVLLGENGVGKSSVLKAAAMALMDEKSLTGLNLDATQILRYGATRGWVKVYVAGYENPFELHFRKGDHHFYKSDPTRLGPVEPNKLLMWVFGFGGTRLLPINDTLAPETGKLAQVQNLFNPFIPLKDARFWLTSLKGRKGRLTFGNSARALKTLLQREADDDFRRLNGRVYYKPADSKHMIPLESLSDGYQSTIALAIDIMSTTLRSWNTAEDSEGIVLLDEIDVHLHPSWKMQIINDLRATFPRMQFLITTHDPLCLLGTRPGEVNILNLDPENDRIIATQVDLPPGITPDQLLTGFWFGLPSVYDSETRALLQQHRQLLRQGTPEDDPTRLELEEDLRKRLGTFAETSLDRMAQSVASQVITEDTEPLSTEKRIAMRDELLKMVRQKREEMQAD